MTGQSHFVETRDVTKMVQFAGILPTTQPKPRPTLTAMEPDNTEDLLEVTATRYRSIVRCNVPGQGQTGPVVAVTLLGSFLKEAIQIALRGMRRFVQYVMGTDML